jgi:hypothetical protein
MIRIPVFRPTSISFAMPVAGALPIDSYFLIAFSMICISKGLHSGFVGQMFRQIL